MIWPVLFPCVVIGIVVWMRGEQNIGRLDRVEIVLLGAMVLLVVGVSIGAGFGLAYVIGERLPSDMNEIPTEHVALVNLRSVDGFSGTIRGSVFLTVGQIGSDRYYYWYEKTGGGAVTPRQLRAGRGTYVFEEDRPDAELKVFDHHLSPRWLKLFGRPDFGRTWHFHVPKGTVQPQQTFEVR